MSAVASRAFREAMGKDWLHENRNRFVVEYYDGRWAVFRIYGRSEVSLILSFFDKEKALQMAGQLGDMYEEGEIV